MQNKLKHLEFIQNTITRMANNSFLLKGWCITIIGALIGLNKDKLDIKIIIIGIFLIIMFWLLDAYYLKQERIFRGLYDEIREKDESEIDFSMKLNTFTSSMDWFNVFFSVTLVLFYGLLLIAISFLGYCL